MTAKKKVSKKVSKKKPAKKKAKTTLVVEPVQFVAIHEVRADQVREKHDPFSPESIRRSVAGVREVEA